MEVLSLMEVRHGYPMHRLREFCSKSNGRDEHDIHLLSRDVFIIWARCKWDNRVRGFILEKVRHLFTSIFVYRAVKFTIACYRV